MLRPGVLRLKRLAACGVLLPVLAACGPAGRPTLDVATTTSVQNSGLLEALLPHVEDATVRVHAAGSGRALQMLSDGVVELVISHAPETEARFLADHPTWSYRKLAYNRFVIVGPAGDPAGVRGAAGAADAFRRVAGRGTFVSRGDESGTHERERRLWRAAGVAPPPDRLLVSGRSMAVALRHAQEKRAYTLSDEATYWQMQPQLDLVVVFEGGELLLNTYALLYARGSAAAARFADWLTRGEGRGRIAGHRVAGRIGFHVWPAACPGAAPAALPCGGRD